MTAHIVFQVSKRRLSDRNIDALIVTNISRTNIRKDSTLFPAARLSSCVIGIEDHHSSGTVGIINNNTCSCTNGVGYGIYRNTSTQTYIYNNICFQNTVGLKASSTTNLNYDYNCLNSNPSNYSGCTQQAHDIDSNPRFYTTFPPPDWSFFLRQNPPQTTGFYSPCKDAGNPFISPYGTTRTDYWPDAGIIDIGAHWPFARIE